VNASRLVALVLLASCGAPAGTGQGEPTPAPTRQAATDATDLIPAGYGSLRQEDVAVRISLPSFLVRAIPLDESVIRTLSPDSYRALRELASGRREAIASLAARHGVRNPSLWYLSYYGLDPDARFSPGEVVITGSGRDFRPLDIVPLTVGFNEQRLRQRETQSAIYLFDEALDVNQPLTITVDTVRSSTWGSTLRTIERERSLVRTRAGQAPRP
jgi:hypothetical protein